MNARRFVTRIHSHLKPLFGNLALEGVTLCVGDADSTVGDRDGIEGRARVVATVSGRDGSGLGDLRGRDRRLLGEVKRSRRATLGKVEDDLMSREDGMDQETIVANYLKKI